MQLSIFDLIEEAEARVAEPPAEAESAGWSKADAPTLEAADHQVEVWVQNELAHAGPRPRIKPAPGQLRAELLAFLQKSPKRGFPSALISHLRNALRIETDRSEILAALSELAGEGLVHDSGRLPQRWLLGPDPRPVRQQFVNVLVQRLQQLESCARESGSESQKPSADPPVFCSDDLTLPDEADMLTPAAELGFLEAVEQGRLDEWNPQGIAVPTVSLLQQLERARSEIDYCLHRAICEDEKAGKPGLSYFEIEDCERGRRIALAMAQDTERVLNQLTVPVHDLLAVLQQIALQKPLPEPEPEPEMGPLATEPAAQQAAPIPMSPEALAALKREIAMIEIYLKLEQAEDDYHELERQAFRDPDPALSDALEAARLHVRQVEVEAKPLIGTRSGLFIKPAVARLDELRCRLAAIDASELTLAGETVVLEETTPALAQPNPIPTPEAEQLAPGSLRIETAYFPEAELARIRPALTVLLPVGATLISIWRDGVGQYQAEFTGPEGRRVGRTWPPSEIERVLADLDLARGQAPDAVACRAQFPADPDCGCAECRRDAIAQLVDLLRARAAGELPPQSRVSFDPDRGWLPEGRCLYRGCQGTYRPGGPAYRSICSANPTHQAWRHHQPGYMAYVSYYGYTYIRVDDWLTGRAPQLGVETPPPKPGEEDELAFLKEALPPKAKTTDQPDNKPKPALRERQVTEPDMLHILKAWLPADAEITEAWLRADHFNVSFTCANDRTQVMGRIITVAEYTKDCPPFTDPDAFDAYGISVDELLEWGPLFQTNQLGQRECTGYVVNRVRRNGKFHRLLQTTNREKALRFYQKELEKALPPAQAPESGGPVLFVPCATCGSTMNAAAGGFRCQGDPSHFLSTETSPGLTHEAKAELSQAADQARQHPEIQRQLNALDQADPPAAKPKKPRTRRKKAPASDEPPAQLLRHIPGHVLVCDPVADWQAALALAGSPPWTYGQVIEPLKILWQEADETALCQLCPGAPLLKHPDLPLWRCSAVADHRFWIAKVSCETNKKGKKVGVWMGRSCKDVGCGPGPVPAWAKEPMNKESKSA